MALINPADSQSILDIIAGEPPSKPKAQAQALRTKPVKQSTSLSSAVEADPLQTQFDRLSADRDTLMQQQDATFKRPDYSGVQQFAQERQGGGQRALMLALAAQEAGQEFQPVQAHFLKRATAAREPMKVTGGMVTEQGFLEDTGHAQELDAKRLDARIRQIDNLLAANVSTQERRRLEREKFENQQELRRMMMGMTSAIAAQSSADRRYAADLAHQDRVAAREATAGRLTDAERVSQGYLHRMRQAEDTITQLGPMSEAPTGMEIGLGFLPGVGPEAANFARSPDRQKVYQAQEDWVRAKLRKESGAVIGDEEMKREIRTYFPLLTDGPEVIEQKRVARAAAERQMEIAGATDRQSQLTPRPGEGPAAAGPVPVQQRARQYYGSP